MFIAIVAGTWLLITLFAVALMRAAARADSLPVEAPIDLDAYRTAKAATPGRRRAAL